MADDFITGGRAWSPVGWLATLLGFGVTIVAILLIYRVAYEKTVDIVSGALGSGMSQMVQVVISMLLLIVFIAIGQWAGRMARDWINAGRPPAPRARRTV